MCGICGYIGEHEPSLLKKMCAIMEHRGPDDSGCYCDARRKIGLGHRRLSIIDLSAAGHQPMANADESIWIVYNGETYDFREHRADLIKRGCQFRGESDTEVLLYLYEVHGIDFLNRINGMFALAIWDARQGELILARDHVGVKPLYYWQSGDRLFFASEAKALLQIPDIPRGMNHKRLYDQLHFLWVPGRDTLFQGIQKLEPGHYLVHKNGRITIRRWFSMQYEPDRSVSSAAWEEQVYATLQRVVERQMVSDVPLGAFLSGGVDSSSIVAMMRHAYPEREITCFTAKANPKDWAEEAFEDDFPYATKVAELFKADLRVIPLHAQLAELLPKLIWHMDEPDADPAIIPSFLICKLARDSGITVLLSGVGGDEIFLGYSSHLAYWRYSQLKAVPEPLGWFFLFLAEQALTMMRGAQSAGSRRLRKFRRGLMQDGLSRHCALVDWSSPRTCRQLLSKELQSSIESEQEIPGCMQTYYDDFQGEGDLNRHSHLLIQTFLACHNFLYADKTSMATSVEVRVPFMDMELMRLCARIPEEVKLSGGVTKSLLKHTMERDIPHRILYRSKTGFGVPLRKWVREDLKDVIQDALSESQIKTRGLFSPVGVQTILRENAENRADHSYLIYNLLTLELWMRTFIDRPAEKVVL